MKTQTNYSSYILPLGILAISYFVLKRIGLIKDSAEEKTKTSQLLSIYWNPNYLKEAAKKNSTKVITQAGANLLADTIYKSKGIFNDNEELFFSAIKEFRYKTQVSQVAEIFRTKYKKDLAAYIQSFLNEKELTQVYTYTDNLPSGII